MCCYRFHHLPHHLPPHSTPRPSSSPLFFCAAMEPSRGGQLLGERNLGASDVSQATSRSSCARARQQAQAASPWASRRLDQASMQPRCRVHGLACVAAREHGGAPAPSAQRYSAPKTWHPGHLAIAVCAVCSECAQGTSPLDDPRTPLLPPCDIHRQSRTGTGPRSCF